MAKKKVFISYDHSEDRRYKDLLAAWDANDQFEFEFDNRSVITAIDSDEAKVVKAAITTKLKTADYLFVIVGEKTHTSTWVNWEVDRAKQADTKLKLAAVKIKGTYTSPAGLLNVGTSWAVGFTLDGVIAALNGAKNTY